MKDLQILEQQEQDSKAEVEKQKVLKAQSLARLQKKETELSQLKYSKGEDQATLQQRRSVLASLSREIGVAKLEGKRGDAEIKAFEMRLRGALATVDRVLRLKRAIDRALFVLQQDKADIQRREAKAAEERRDAETGRDEMRRQEKLFISQIQSLKARDRDLTQKIARLRGETTGLENDLSSCQLMSASTASSLESTELDLTTETERAARMRTCLDSKIKQAQGVCSDHGSSIESLHTDLKARKSEGVAVQAKTRKYQQEEGLEVSPEQSDDIQARLFVGLDVVKIRSKHESEAAAFRRDRAEHQELADLIRVLEQETAATIAKREATFSDIDRRKNSINEHRMKLDDRKQIIEQSQSDLHDQRSKVFALQKGADDLRRGLEESKIASREKIVRYEKRLETSMIKSSCLQEEGGALRKLVEEAKHDFEHQRCRETNAVTEAKADAKAIYATSNALHDKRRKEERSSTPILEDDPILQEDIKAMMKDTKFHEEEKVEILHAHPCLANLIIDNDPNVSVADQVEQITSGLRESCQEAIAAAFQNREDRVRAHEREVFERKRIEKEMEAQQLAKAEAKERDRRRLAKEELQLHLRRHQQTADTERRRQKEVARAARLAEKERLLQEEQDLLQLQRQREGEKAAEDERRRAEDERLKEEEEHEQQRRREKERRKKKEQIHAKEEEEAGSIGKRTKVGRPKETKKRNKAKSTKPNPFGGSKPNPFSSITSSNDPNPTKTKKRSDVEASHPEGKPKRIKTSKEKSRKGKSKPSTGSIKFDLFSANHGKSASVPKQSKHNIFSRSKPEKSKNRKSRGLLSQQASGISSTEQKPGGRRRKSAGGKKKNRGFGTMSAAGDDYNFL